MGLIEALIALAVAIVGGLGLYVGGRHTGAKDAREEEAVKDYERVLGNLGKRETADTDARSGGDATDRLRKDWRRD